LVDDFNLQQDIPDHHQWRLTGYGSYLSKSAYGLFYWDHKFCTLEADMEILGPSLLQILLFGWQLRATVGQLTALQKEDFLTRLFVPYATKLMKQYSIPWLLVFSQSRFGQLSFMCWACFPLHQS